jgi:hypothetical protein
MARTRRRARAVARRVRSRVRSAASGLNVRTALPSAAAATAGFIVTDRVRAMLGRSNPQLVAGWGGVLAEAIIAGLAGFALRRASPKLARDFAVGGMAKAGVSAFARLAPAQAAPTVSGLGSIGVASDVIEYSALGEYPQMLEGVDEDGNPVMLDGMGNVYDYAE